MVPFNVGDKVVCLDDIHWVRRVGIAFPAKHTVYTVRSFDDRGTMLAVRLVEIINEECLHQGGIFTEPAFAACCFRPLVELKTDISLFTALLDKTPETVT